MIGTAGHVDHGKSTLIEALTGRDPDRWEIEKSRGLTIDLGFSWTQLPSGEEVSFVDVPGHERYLKNMLAGIEMIDVALLVVAANEGWMPQSEEHLAVLDLLEVDRGVVAVTKTDLVDQETAELAVLEVADNIKGTTLERAELVPVSATRGTGMSALVAALDAAVAGGPGGGSRPRMWIDRAFTVAGAGTVVTGTLMGGQLDVGQRVEILPVGIDATVRGLQSHERQLETARPGTRVAVNLRGVSPTEVARGSMLGLKGQWELTARFSASLREARYAEKISPKGAYQLHVGSGAHPVSIDGLDDGHMIARTRTALPLASGDRFILRDTGRRQVVGGGQILDPAPSALTDALAQAPEIDPSTGPDHVADRLLETRRVDSVARLSAHSGGGKPGRAVIAGPTAVSARHARHLRETTRSLLEEDHARHPLREGLPLATLAERLGVDQELAEVIIQGQDDVVIEGSVAHLHDHIARLSKDQAEAWARARSVLASDLAVPTAAELGLDSESVHYLLRAGELIGVTPELVILPEQRDQIRQTIAKLGDGFTVSEFGAAAGLSRKHSVPYLEWADGLGLTFRRGDLRYESGSDH